jgi:hypothetical protein
MNNPLRTPEDYELFLYTHTSHPHHKHVPPNVKHHRIPAPEMSFTRRNLPVLIRDIEALLKH